MLPLTMYGIREDRPGPRWRAMFEALWPAYRRWYLRDGDDARPDLSTAVGALQRHMPELVPTWERLFELTGEDPVAGRMLTLWDPPTFAPGCSQAVWPGASPALVRNYDYGPELFEAVVYSSQFGDRSVIGTGDCLWGLVDGMNSDGLAVSLAFGGRPGSGPGFGAPLVLRYLLEVAGSTAEARDRLEGLPVSMAYNLTLLDRTGAATTAFVAPGERPQFFDGPATNHRGQTPEHPEHAARYRSTQRQQVLTTRLAERPSLAEFTKSFQVPPLYSDDYAHAFGTLYTAVYRPADGAVDYVWPGERWTRTFSSPEETRVVNLGSPEDADRADGADGAAPDPAVAELGREIRELIGQLSRQPDPGAFAELLSLYETVGVALAEAARTLAGAGSWSQVADVAGVSKQAAWYRWRG